MRRGDSKIIEQLKHRPAGAKGESRVFLHLDNLVAHYGRTARGRNAILGPGYSPVSYGALQVRLNDALRGLRSLGVGRGDRVAVVLPDGPETAVAILAVAAAAICVPLNPNFTAGEWRRYFGDLQPAVLLTRADMESPSRSIAHSLGITVIDLSLRPGEGGGAFDLLGSGSRRAVSTELVPSADDDAFILLTSSTTSLPKMVPLTHANVCRSAFNASVVLRLTPRDRLLNVLPLYHAHGLISGLLAALAAGSAAVCTPGFDPDAFFGWLTEFRPTWYTAIPAIHRALLSAADSHKDSLRHCSLRVIRSGSSSLPPDLVHDMEAVFGVPVIETYGMTEAAQIAANRLARRKPGSVGRPMGVEIAILDAEGRPLPCGDRGEIALRGPTVTRGYDNDTVATESAFRDGWFRTGDLGYLDADGYLFIVGRAKDVIKRGGHQVAPADVEEALLSHPDVVEATVFSIPHERLGQDVAAAVVLRPDVKVSAQKLRIFARERLAAFKVPGPIHIVPEIPKGPGGKIKRGELAATLSSTSRAAQGERGRNLVPPRSELERQLAKIWADLLEVDDVELDQDFFTLGADSITVMQGLMRLEARFGVDLTLEDIFEAPTVAALAARFKSLGKDRSCGLPMDSARTKRRGPGPVSILQEQVLKIELAFPGIPQFILPFAYRLLGRLNVDALNRGLAGVVRRHESLRTAFEWRGESVLALITPPANIDSILVLEDFAVSVPAGNDRAKALLLKKAELVAQSDALTVLDTRSAPVLRARLFRLGTDDHVLLLTLHEAIVDGWSVQILMEELSRLYEAFSAGRQPALPKPELQFPDFAHWQRRWTSSDAATEQFTYWKEHLRGASPVFSASYDRGGGLLAAQVAQEAIHISNDLVGRLSTLSHSKGATLFMTLLTGFKVLLLARSGRSDICVATAVANRSQPGLERLIGPVANTAIIRTQIDGDLSFEEALSRVRSSVLEACTRQDLPFKIVAARLSEEDGLRPASLFQVFFVLRNAFRSRLKLPGVVVRPFAHLEGQPAMPIDPSWLKLTITETPSGITGACRYKKELFERAGFKPWIADYHTILTKAVANPRISLGRLADC
jgi:acyl-CoA synthetase (AMP-forming)/AMP-acid ligase II/acyl carrier protein